MKVAIGCDHRGVELKNRVKAVLMRLGHEVVDFGTHSKNSVDYPDYGLMVARAVAAGDAEYGVTICWTGNGMNIAANKVKGIRAGMAVDREMAELTRLHNDANVITLSQKYTDLNQLDEIISAFLNTKFEGGRHLPRVQKIMAAESQ